MKDAFTDSPSEAAVEVPRTTPDQAYNAGVLLMERGDYDAARREWDRCVAMSPPDSSSRVDCAVALEKLATPGPIEQ
jgi:Flp pilus assembly protein TadD